ncbi:MAG: response regulator [Chloroflexota bacterium]
MSKDVKVVHLEDEGALKDVIKELVGILERDIDLIQFSTSAEVLDYVQTEQDIALFILDVRVPGQMDGMQLAEKLREIGFTCPIAIASAYMEPDIEWLNKWDCHYFPKPLHALHLQTKILPLARQ